MASVTLQDDLLKIIRRFRLHQHVLSVEMSSMSTKILVKEETKQYQRISGKDSDDCYNINAVTGTTYTLFCSNN